MKWFLSIFGASIFIVILLFGIGAVILFDTVSHTLAWGGLIGLTLIGASIIRLTCFRNFNPKYFLWWIFRK